MKKIISRYYFFVVILLVIAYQYFSYLVLHSEFAANLSGFSYYFSDMMLKFLVVLLVFVFMVGAGKWQQINSRKFKGSYLFYSFLAFLALFGILLNFSYSHLPKMDLLTNSLLRLLQALRRF